MSLSSTEIALIAQHLAGNCMGGRVRKTYGRDRDSIVLQVRARGENVLVLLSAHPKLCRAHTVLSKGDWKHSSAFVTAMRQRLDGAVATSVESIPGDRRLRIHFDLGEKTYVLEAELFGIGSNLILVDGDGKVVEALHHARGERKIVLPGRPYTAPPAVQPKTPKSRFGTEPREVDRAVREHYEPLQAQADVEDARKRVASRLKPVRKKAEGKVRSLTAAAERLVDAEAEKQKGELLKASLHQVRAGADSVSVPNYFEVDTPQVEIKLDPKLDAMGNAQRYFKRHRKIKTAAQLAEEQLPEAQQEAARVREAEDRLAQADSVGAIDAVCRNVFGKPLDGDAKREPQHPPVGPRQFTSSDGLTVLVGRTEAENDQVTFRMANGNDYWLHVQGRPGSHVIVKAQKGKSVPLGTLLDAAALAKLYSSAKDADAADVDYTQRKYVKKRKGAGPGDVDYWDYKTLHVRQDQTRLKRLFGDGA